MKKIFSTITYNIKALFRRPFTWKKVLKIIVLVIIIVFVSNIITKDETETKTEAVKTPIVFVGTVADVQKSEGASFVGTVRAVSEAQIQSETSGRVTSVFVQPGDNVAAGVILASLENASEQASLLQAQGAYEAALAGAAQSEITATDAENALLSSQNNARTTYRNSLASLDNEIKNTVDKLFTDTSKNIIGFKLSATGIPQELISDRKQIKNILGEWSESSFKLEESTDILVMIEKAKSDTLFVADFIEKLSVEVNDPDQDNATVDGESIQTFRSEFNGTRTAVNAILLNLESSKISLERARETLRKAEIGATQNTETSLANAQVKQALGSVRSAQAMYEKTIFRTPISGTVNSLNINVGDFVNAFTQVAEVANNDALQISIFVGEKDLLNFTVGNEVMINNEVTGIITSVAPGVDSATQKTEVKIGTESSELTNGSTVTIETSASTQFENADTPLYIPITAIKFEAKDGSVFTVEEGTLVSNPVTLGNIQGTSVEIIDGISKDTVFLIDARGFVEGQKVEVSDNSK